MSDTSLCSRFWGEIVTGVTQILDNWKSLMIFAFNVSNVLRFANVMVTNFTVNQSFSVQWIGVPVSNLNSCYASPNFSYLFFYSSPLLPLHYPLSLNEFPMCLFSVLLFLSLKACLSIFCHLYEISHNKWLAPQPSLARTEIFKLASCLSAAMLFKINLVTDSGRVCCQRARSSW